jgi:hypothetical protein
LAEKYEQERDGLLSALGLPSQRNVLSANWTISTPLPIESSLREQKKEPAKDFPYRHEAGFVLA